MVLGASFDSPRENRKFRDKFAFPFDLVCDQTREVGMAYGVADAPDDPYAARVSYLIGLLGQIERVYKDFDPAAHPDTVLADIEALA